MSDDSAESLSDEIFNINKYNYYGHIITEHDDSNGSPTDTSFENNENEEENNVLTTRLYKISFDDAVNLRMTTRDCFLMMLGCLVNCQEYLNSKDDNEKLKNQITLGNLVLINSCKNFGFEKIEYKDKNIHFWESLNRAPTDFAVVQHSTPKVVEKSSLGQLSTSAENRQQSSYSVEPANTIIEDISGIGNGEDHQPRSTFPGNSKRGTTVLEKKVKNTCRQNVRKSRKRNPGNDVNLKRSTRVRNVLPVDRMARVKMIIKKALEKSPNEVNNKSMIKKASPRQRNSGTNIKKINKKGLEGGKNSSKTMQSPKQSVSPNTNRKNYSLARDASFCYDGLLTKNNETQTDDLGTSMYLELPNSKNTKQTNRNLTNNKSPKKLNIKTKLFKDQEENNVLLGALAGGIKGPRDNSKNKFQTSEGAADVLGIKNNSKKQNLIKENPDNTINVRRSTRVHNELPIHRIDRVKMEIQRALGKSVNEVEQKQPLKRKSEGDIQKVTKKGKRSTPLVHQKSFKKPLYSPDAWLHSFNS